MRRVETGVTYVYLKQITHKALLSAEMELELCRRMGNGDTDARNTLVEHNLRFVVFVAKRYTGPSNTLNDLIQVGSLGLLKATEHFDPSRGIRFASYAAWWVRAFIARFCAHNRSHVKRDKKVPIYSPDISMDDSERGADSAFVDTLPSDISPADLDYLTRERDLRVNAALSSVRKRIGPMGWDIVENRLMHSEPKSLEEMGRSWGVSRESVRISELRTKQFLSRYLGEILEA